MGSLRHLFSRKGLQYLVLALVGVLSVILISIASNALYDDWKGTYGFSNTEIGLAFAGLGLLTTWMLAVTTAFRTFRGSSARRWPLGSSKPCDRRVVILMPSWVTKEKAELAQNIAKSLPIEPSARAAAIAKLTEAGSPLDMHSWQQSVRLVRQFPQLERIIAIPTKDVANEKQLEPFKKLIRAVGAPGLIIQQIGDPVDPANYNDVEKAMDAALKIAHDEGYSEPDICIDITSGPKSFSAVAAIRTLNSNLIFSYVMTRIEAGNSSSTANEVGKVYIYDAVVWSEYDG